MFRSVIDIVFRSDYELVDCAVDMAVLRALQVASEL